MPQQVAGLLRLGDPLVQFTQLPVHRFPPGAAGAVQDRPDRFESESELLGHPDEREPPQLLPPVPPPATDPPGGVDQAAFLVVAQRRGSDPDPPGCFPDRDQLIHASS